MLQIKSKCSTDLNTIAREIYFSRVKAEQYRTNFLNQLSHRIVVDKRMSGYYCSYCGKFKDTQMMSFSRDTPSVIFPNSNKNEIWIVNGHYDGCRGWD